MPLICTLRKVTPQQINQEICPGIYYLGRAPMFVYTYERIRGQPFRNVVRCARRQQAMRLIRERHPTLIFRFYR